MSLQIMMLSYPFNQPDGRQVWQLQPLIHSQHVQRDFLKYRAQRIKHDLLKNHPELLAHFESDANDRSPVGLSLQQIKESSIVVLMSATQD
jgi:hypothetical protein